MATVAEVAEALDFKEESEENSSEIPEVVETAKLLEASTTCDILALAAENEVTPEVTKTATVEQNISPASAAVMQSLFYKEMMAKTNTEDDSSSTTDSVETTHDEDCSCQDIDSTEVESGVENSPQINNVKAFKSFDLSDFVDEDETTSKDATCMENDFNEEQGDEDLPKEEVIMNILRDLDPQDVEQVRL